MMRFVQPLQGVTPAASPLDYYKQAMGNILQPQLTKAQIEHLQQPSNMIGPAAEVAGIQSLVKQYGENSPQVKAAKAGMNAKYGSLSAKAGYYAANNLTKNLTPLMKQQLSNEVLKKTGKTLAQVLSEGMLSSTPGIVAQGGSAGQLWQTPGSQPTVSPLVGAVTPAQGMQTPTGTAPQPGAQVSTAPPPHPAATTAVQTPAQKATVNAQIRQGEQSVNKLSGDATARKALAPATILAKQINDIDITPVANYAGLKGRAKSTYDRAKMALGIRTPAENDTYRAYNTFTTTTLPGIIDQMRKALQTSVREGYVNNYIKPMLDPAQWHNDPQQAVQNFNYTRKWMNERVKMLTKMANEGIALNSAEADKMTDNFNKKMNPSGAGIPAYSPKKQTGMKLMRTKNPTYSEKELSDAYDNRYGTQ